MSNDWSSECAWPRCCFWGILTFFSLNRHLTLTADLCFLPSGSVHGSLYCAVPSCCSSFGPTSGWLLKMISMTSTGESLWCPFNFGTVKIRKAVFVIWVVILPTHGRWPNLCSFTHQVGVQSFWRVEGWNNSHPYIHHPGTQLCQLPTGQLSHTELWLAPVDVLTP